ncbi:hypothetical protein EMIHUDRAFT_107489 [Emiliania huxleyi CCMP1516]|uniref:MPN domain-containing protein n=2 Tax=Emiliania huxleyi TaxID=2903 RepID=A0A0D3I0M4_EMIH1|nr:hypothetical protein EMIHUDRAFT_107489 [Emiliania huxleyi CCMP1516]EOD04809.1 hypothetical protein EMIHUDRAFT_107489 [Emiliania huxleyi CCMP1516]|eukprot:XP_005757238.1 hypothetical protein EMIHUDRAFT_107489 [Emiliania huxleyi CCMP1516]
MFSSSHLHVPGGVEVEVHPVVLFSVVDHYSRREEGQGRVIGTLLGTGAPVEIFSCFPVPHTESEEQVAVNTDFHATMLSLYQRVVGWYSTGDGVSDSSLLFHDFYGQDVERPVHLLVDLGLGTRRMSCKAYVSKQLSLGGATLGTSFEEGVRKLDRHYGYYLCALCSTKKGALFGETGTIGSNCSNVLRHTAGESHLRAWLADLPVDAEKPTLAKLQTSIAHKWLGSARSQRTTQTKVRVQRKAQKIATSAAVDAAVAAGRAAAGALTPVTPAATQLPPSYGVITPAAAAAWGAQMAAQAQAAAAQTAAATPTQTP